LGNVGTLIAFRAGQRMPSP